MRHGRITLGDPHVSSDFALALRYQHMAWVAMQEAMAGGLHLAYVIAEDRYYLVAEDQTEAVPMPRALNTTLVELNKPRVARVRSAPYGRELMAWPPTKERACES